MNKREISGATTQTMAQLKQNLAKEEVAQILQRVRNRRSIGFSGKIDQRRFTFSIEDAAAQRQEKKFQIAARNTV